jgi:MFS family permease
VSVATGAPPVRVSAWSPLRHPVFRAIWIASVASNVGTLMHGVGAAWLMTSLDASPLAVSLVQAAANAPLFILALPAGALADVVDRRRLLIATEIWMVAAAAGLGLATLAGVIGPWGLLAFTFALAVGAALNAPAWQAVMPELVPSSEVPEGLALGGVGFNLARAVGPTLGGFVVATWGPAPTFFLNSISFLGVIVVLYRWRRTPEPELLPAERFVGALRAGLRYARSSPELRAVFVRGMAFTLFASALWALLPVVVHQELRRGPDAYGVLLGALGLGAVVGAAVLPRLRRRLGWDTVVSMASVGFALAMLALATVSAFPLLCVALLLGGAAWLGGLTTLNAAIQQSVASWVRARALSVYLLVFFGSLSLGSVLWGWVGERLGVPAALVLAAAGMITGLFLSRRFRIRSGAVADLAPSLHWPPPAVAFETEAQNGPVLVMVEYRIDPARAAEFTAAMQELRRIRRRDGGMRWNLYKDTADPGRYVESYVSESWVDHLRQHERVTAADRVIEERARAFHIGPTPPVVSHLIQEGRLN